jgi:hypothetical protein
MEFLKPKQSPQQNIVMRVLNILVDYNSDIIHYNNALDSFNELGGLDGVGKIMKWDDSVKENWKIKIQNVYNIK